MTPNTTDPIVLADAAIEVARGSFDVVAVGHGRNTAEYQELLARASAADTERARLDGRRKGLLLSAHRDHDSEAAAELRSLPGTIADLERTAAECREAAAMLRPALDESAAKHTAAARALALATFDRDRLVYVRETATLEAVVGALQPALADWLEGADRFERAHVAAFGKPTPLEPATFRAARMLSVRIRQIVGPQNMQTIGRAYPEVCGSLLPDIRSIVAV